MTTRTPHSEDSIGMSFNAILGISHFAPVLYPLLLGTHLSHTHPNVMKKIRGSCFYSRPRACLKLLTQSPRYLRSNGSEYLASVVGKYFCPAECEAKHSGGRRRENTRHEGVRPQLLLQTPSEFLELRVLDLGYNDFCSSGTSRSRAQAKR